MNMLAQSFNADYNSDDGVLVFTVTGLWGYRQCAVGQLILDKMMPCQVSLAHPHSQHMPACFQDVFEMFFVGNSRGETVKPGLSESSRWRCATFSAPWRCCRAPPSNSMPRCHWAQLGTTGHTWLEKVAMPIASNS